MIRRELVSGWLFLEGGWPEIGTSGLCTVCTYLGRYSTSCRMGGWMVGWLLA